MQIVRGQNFTHQRRVCFGRPGRREQRRGVVAQVGVWDGHCRHVMIHSHLSTFHHCSVWRVSAEVFSTRVPCVSATTLASLRAPARAPRRRGLGRAGGGGRRRARAPPGGPSMHAMQHQDGRERTLELLDVQRMLGIILVVPSRL